MYILKSVTEVFLSIVHEPVFKSSTFAVAFLLSFYLQYFNLVLWNSDFFFDSQHYFKFRDYLNRLGVDVPLVPGIISILSASQIRRFVAMCGANLPPGLQTELDKRADDDAAAAEFGIEYATRQCEELLKAGVPGLHFYTLNKAQSTTRILQNLGLA